MLRQKALLPFTCLLAFAAAVLPPGASWTNFIPKPVYSRALGPMGPTGMDTISVPYMAKPSLFPKFVDPKTMISKKTDMLSNLFGGMGPIMYNPVDAKPIPLYGASGSPLDNVGTADKIMFSKKRDTLQADKAKTLDGSGGVMYKRGMLGPFASKFGPMGPKFGPMGPKFGPMGPKFGSMTPFSSADMTSDYAATGNDFFSRRRRSIAGASAAGGDSVPADKTQILNLGLAPPSSYAKGLDSVEGAADATSAADDTPKESFPGMFGPFGGPFGGPFAGPFGGPIGPVVDPSMLIAKKTTFLDTLFKNLATSTAAPPTSTDVPAPKSTIVPPSYWIPSSIVPDPTEYTSKVSDFLDKLFDSIKLNTTVKATDDDSSEAKSGFMMMRSLKPDDATADRTARASEDLSTIAAAKDAVVDAILSELGDLKGDMMATLNDLIAYEKTVAAASAATTKKPFKPFAGIFPPKPTVDATLPFQQRMTVLSQVFDMLTNLQRNITAATNNAMTANAGAADTSEEPSPSKSPSAVGASSFNATLLDAVLKKLSTVVTPAPYAASDVKAGPIITSRALSKGPTSFWVSYPENGATAKRQADDYPYFDDDERHDHRQFTRGVKMQMHQGYQSLPAGSVESVQAGGGSTPGHQGGGIKLLGPNAYGNLNSKWLDWMQYHKNEYQDQENHRHHHNHH